MKIVIKNISELVQTETTARKWVAGKEMASINTIKDAFVEIEEGLITSFGSMEDWAGIEDWNNTEIIDAEGGIVFPTYCDSHTHLVFAASREGEFVDRINARISFGLRGVERQLGSVINPIQPRKIRDCMQERGKG
mgnify:CR=1 FL=1